MKSRWFDPGTALGGRARRVLVEPARALRSAVDELARDVRGRGARG